MLHSTTRPQQSAVIDFAGHPSFPLDMIAEILSYLSLPDMARLWRTNKSFKTLASVRGLYRPWSLLFNSRVSDHLSQYDNANLEFNKNWHTIIKKRFDQKEKLKLEEPLVNALSTLTGLWPEEIERFVKINLQILSLSNAKIGSISMQQFFGLSKGTLRLAEIEKKPIPFHQELKRICNLRKNPPLS
jgi:hypothetical protein